MDYPFQLPKTGWTFVMPNKFGIMTTYLTSDLPLRVNDLIYDQGDGYCGYVDSINKDSVSVRDKHVVEIGIPLNRVVKLIPFAEYDMPYTSLN